MILTNKNASVIHKQLNRNYYKALFQLKFLKSNVKYTYMRSLEICFYNFFLKVLNKKLSELHSWSSRTILNNTI